MLLPPPQTVNLILPEAIFLDEMLWAFVEPHVTLQERVTLRADDFNPSFEIYRWSVQETLSDLRPIMTVPSQLARLPVDVGEWLSFQGYQLVGWTGEPGDEFSLLTLWQVRERLPDDRDGVFFTQLLDSQSRVIDQRDKLDAPSWDWQPGDVILQLHTLSLPVDALLGQYTLIAGAYTVPDRVDAVLSGHAPDPSMPRLPVLVDGVAVSDHILLQVVEVAGE